ncbi:tyrosine-type recombinase/integrase [Novipirellula sp. SH528]|uniref:tyrosine-type recombinase/integrase n=1 Tax=Novipirellula sp. SH528 TaxID=3454466 RepID=UPI003FA08650
MDRRKVPSDCVFRVPSGLLDILDKDIEAAGIPKVDSEGRVVHVHALRHSFGTHLSKVGVTPRVAQAAMRHSNISLTMTTYTDPRLLDTAAAVESLPTFDEPRMLAPTLAPNLGNCGKSGSLAVHSAGISDDERFGPRTKKTRESRGFSDAAERTRTSTGLTPTRPSIPSLTVEIGWQLSCNRTAHMQLRQTHVEVELYPNWT